MGRDLVDDLSSGSRRVQTQNVTNSCFPKMLLDLLSYSSTLWLSLVFVLYVSRRLALHQWFNVSLLSYVPRYNQIICFAYSSAKYYMHNPRLSTMRFKIVH